MLSVILLVCSNRPTTAILPPTSPSFSCLSVSYVCLKEEVNYRSGLIEWVPCGRGRGMISSNEAYISGPQPANGIDLSLCVVSVCPCEYERLKYMCRMIVVFQTTKEDGEICLYICVNRRSFQP